MVLSDVPGTASGRSALTEQLNLGLTRCHQRLPQPSHVEATLRSTRLESWRGTPRCGSRTCMPSALGLCGPAHVKPRGLARGRGPRVGSTPAHTPPTRTRPVVGKRTTANEGQHRLG